MKIPKNIDSLIFNDINVGVYRNTPGTHGKFIRVNDALVRMFGYSNQKEFLKKVRPSDVYFYSGDRKKFSELLAKKGFVRRKELVLKRRDGTLAYVQITATAVKDKRGKVRWFDGIIEDVTKFRREQERFRHIFENSPVAIWEEDLSAVLQLIRRLQKQGTKDLRKYFLSHPAIVAHAFRNIKILDINKAALQLYGAKNKKELVKNFGKTFAAGALEILTDEFLTLAKGEKNFSTELKSRTIDGKMRDVLLRVSVPDGYERSLSRVIVTLEDITERKQLERHLKKVAQQDGLTKLFNSRAISKRLDEELIRAKRYNLNLSCLMLDVDYFKVINDKFGHQKGDQILKRVATLIKTSLRRSDIVGRYGGDEFLAILTQTKPENAKIAAERIRQLVTAQRFPSYKNIPTKITVSIGVSGYPHKDVKDFRNLISNADKALYLAKGSGRDCVILS
ncbi:MAG: diguanylate cyclase [Candidatus Omnitrophota bacterium]